MSTLITWNGSNFIMPQTNEVGWGTNLTSFFVALPAGALQKTGGSFTLSAETDFGGAYGLKSLYYKSRTANPASAGQLRLASTDLINFRNNAHDADISLEKDTSDNLKWNTKKLLLSGDVVNADISASALITRSKLATGTPYTVTANGADGALSELAGLGSSGDVLTSNGAGALPTFKSDTKDAIATINTFLSTHFGNVADEIVIPNTITTVIATGAPIYVSGAATIPFIQTAGVGNASMFMGYGAGQTISTDIGTLSGTTAYGAFAMQSATADSHSCTAVGTNALAANTTGFENSAFGLNSLTRNTSGLSNSAFGAYSLQKLISGTNNTAIGQAALRELTTANHNTALGYGALQSVVTGTANTGLGFQALNQCLSEYNCVVGWQGMAELIDGSYNTAVGTEVSHNITHGARNTMMGYQSGLNLTTGNDNTILGYQSALSLGSASSNTGVGANNLYQATSSFNTAMGFDSLAGLTSGANNTAIGYQAGKGATALSTGHDCVFLGYRAYPGANNLANAIAIGASAIVAASNTCQIGGAAGSGSEINLKVNSAEFASTVKKPGQPAFLATGNGSTQTHVTGDGTVYTVLFQTVVYDQASNYDGTSTFTAPVTGKYSLCATVTVSGLSGVNNETYCRLVTSNRTYRQIINPTSSYISGGFFTYHVCVIADMDAGDTATVAIEILGGTKIVNVSSNAQYTYFSGTLVC